MQLDECGRFQGIFYIKFKNNRSLFERVFGFPEFKFFFKYQGVWYADSPVGGRTIEDFVLICRLSRILCEFE